MRTISTRPKRDACRLRSRICTDPRSAACRSAFSIVELTIVVMIIGVLAAVAVPTFFDSLLFHQVESAAHRMKSDLELARQTARLTSTTQSLSFTGPAYVLSSGISSLDNPLDDYVVDLSAAPFYLERVTADFSGDNAVSFDGYAADHDQRRYHRARIEISQVHRHARRGDGRGHDQQRPFRRTHRESCRANRSRLSV